MAKHRPILFSGPMVRAILDGRKTQTRRIVKDRFWDIQSGPENCMNGFRRIDGDCAVWEIQDTVDSTHERRIPCPYGVPGDTLWVREPWFCEGREQPGQGLHYRANACEADEAWFKEEGWKWKPSIHMPRWASRITLEVTDVWIERVQEISEEDAKAEGVVPPGCDHPDCVGNTATTCAMRRCRPQFAALWQELNAKRGFGWEANPWVWELTFKTAQKAEHGDPKTD